jgi:hypothetical protein
MSAESVSEAALARTSSPTTHRTGEQYDSLIAKAKKVSASTTIVVYSCDETSLRGPIKAAEAGIIVPILVGPATKITAIAREHKLDISRFEIVDVPHGEAAAAKAVELIRQAKGELLMKRTCTPVSLCGRLPHQPPARAPGDGSATFLLWTSPPMPRPFLSPTLQSTYSLIST